MYMEEKTTKLTIHEFRKNLKSALDFCVAGGMVELDRMGQKFMLTHIPRGMDVMIGGVDPARPGSDKSVEVVTKLEKGKKPKVVMVDGQELCEHGKEKWGCMNATCPWFVGNKNVKPDNSKS